MKHKSLNKIQLFCLIQCAAKIINLKAKNSSIFVFGKIGKCMDKRDTPTIGRVSNKIEKT